MKDCTVKGDIKVLGVDQMFFSLELYSPGELDECS